MCCSTHTQVTLVIVVEVWSKVVVKYVNSVGAVAVRTVYKRHDITRRVSKTKVIDMQEEAEYVENVIESFHFKSRSKKNCRNLMLIRN